MTHYKVIEKNIHRFDIKHCRTLKEAQEFMALASEAESGHEEIILCSCGVYDEKF